MQIFVIIQCKAIYAKSLILFICFKSSVFVVFFHSKKKQKKQQQQTNKKQQQQQQKKKTTTTNNNNKKQQQQQKKKKKKKKKTANYAKFDRVYALEVDIQLVLLVQNYWHYHNTPRIIVSL